MADPKPVSAKFAYERITAHIGEKGGKPSDWYAGIAFDWESRLFTDHRAPQIKDQFGVAQCNSDSEAREVEAKLLEYGCDGGPSGGDHSTVFVYIYLKGPGTNP